MRVEQAIFTSLARNGRAGYHLVAWSPGVTDADARALASWAPSHGSLIADAWNRVSVNFHPLPGGRHALSRTCRGPAEYSGRGGRQLYTHILVLDEAQLRQSAFQVLALYRDALAQGHLCYRPKPPEALAPAAISDSYARAEAREWSARAAERGLTGLEALRGRLAAGSALIHAHAGCRLTLVECLLGLIEPEARAGISFATSLVPSRMRPYRLTLTGAEPAGPDRSPARPGPLMRPGSTP